MVELADATVLAVLTRAPSAGGKSRLFAALGRPVDPALLTALLLDTLTSASVPGAIQVVAVEPGDGCDEIRQLVPAAHVIPQPSGTLGDRMRGVMQSLLDGGARAVALIGSDLPDIDTAAVAEAFAELHRDPDAIVLGPAADGGYYLVGAARLPDIFDDAIAWGTPVVLEQTLAATAARGLRVHLLPRTGDVDTVADLRRVRAPRTRAWRVRAGV
jgi:uncharacterized protein